MSGISLNSPVVGQGGSAEQAMAYAFLHGAKRYDDVIAYTEELERLCRLTGLSFPILFAQAAHETANFTSHFWEAELNPAGIGKFDDGSSQSIVYRNGAEAARAHVVHMVAYVYGNVSGDPMRQELLPYMRLDPRWNAVIDADFAGTVDILGDLGNGKWATDPQYAQKIAAKANQLFIGEQPMAELTFGKVPYPAVTPRHLPIENEWVKSGAPLVPEAVVWHRMIGTLWGTDTWFFGDHAATAYGVGVIAQDGQDDAGRIIEWMAPSSGYYGESSGPAKGPYGDGAKLIQRVGLDYNRVTKAIEISGVSYDVPLDEPARAAIVNLTAYFADQKKIPWNEFPNVPGQDRSFVIWHQEICGPAEKACPGSVVMNETSALIKRVADVLKRYQTGGAVIVPPKYAEPDLPSWFAKSVEQNWPTDQSTDGIRYYVCRRNFVAKTGTRRMSAPDGKADRSGPNVKAAEKVNGERYVIAPDKSRWILTNDGHFVAASRLSPPVKIG